MVLLDLFLGEHDRSKSWRDVLKRKLEKLYEDDHQDAMRDAVREYAKENVSDKKEEQDRGRK